MSDEPTTMSTIPAVAGAATGDARFVDATAEIPTLRARDLLVRVEAVSVNPVDVKVLAGHQEGERVLGYDAAGVVIQVGSQVELFAPGDRVFYAGDITRAGTNAEQHAVDERLVGHAPTSLSFAAAAALPLTAITAWEGLFDKLRIGPDDEGTLLVVGATGGVGAMVLQLCRALLPGVRVIGTASAANRDQALAWGAHDTVDHHQDLAPQLSAAAPDGVDWVFTSRSADDGQLALYEQVLVPFGAVVAIDDATSMDVASFKDKSLSFHWELMFTRAIAGGEGQLAQHRLLEEVSRLVDAGRVTSTVATTLTPLDAERLTQAHELVGADRVVGKVVVAREA